MERALSDDLQRVVSEITVDDNRHVTLITEQGEVHADVSALEPVDTAIRRALVLWEGAELEVRLGGEIIDEQDTFEGNDLEDGARLDVRVCLRKTRNVNFRWPADYASFDRLHAEHIKTVVVGDSKTGKTSLIHGLSQIGGRFDNIDHVPTVFDNYESGPIDDDNGPPFFLDLWDTAGSEDYSRLRPLSYPDTVLFLVLFRLDEGPSLTVARERYLASELRAIEDSSRYPGRISALSILVGTRLPDQPMGLGRPAREAVSAILHEHPECFGYIECCLDREGIKYLQAELCVLLRAVQGGQKARRL